MVNSCKLIKLWEAEGSHWGASVDDSIPLQSFTTKRLVSSSLQAWSPFYCCLTRVAERGSRQFYIGQGIPWRKSYLNPEEAWSIISVPPKKIYTAPWWVFRTVWEFSWGGWVSEPVNTPQLNPGSLTGMETDILPLISIRHCSSHCHSASGYLVEVMRLTTWVQRDCLSRACALLPVSFCATGTVLLDRLALVHPSLLSLGMTWFLKLLQQHLSFLLTSEGSSGLQSPELSDSMTMHLASVVEKTLWYWDQTCFSIWPFLFCCTSFHRSCPIRGLLSSRFVSWFLRPCSRHGFQILASYLLAC